MVDQEAVYAAVTTQPRTSKEIASFLVVPSHEVALPLRELYETGKIKRETRKATYDDKSPFVYWVA